MFSGLSFSHSWIAMSGDVSGPILTPIGLAMRDDEVDVRAVELPGPLADPQEVAGQPVRLAVGDPGQRTVVLERQRLVRAVQRRRTQRVVLGHATGADERQRPVDLLRERLVALAGPGRRDEALVPVVHRVQVGHAATEVGAQHVHRAGRVRVRADHALRIGDASGLGRLQRIDHVAAIGRQPERVERRRARLRVLPGDPRHLDHRQARAVGQHDRHLQQRARVRRAGAPRCCRRTSRRSRRPAA